jgi:hypothetical protein
MKNYAVKVWRKASKNESKRELGTVTVQAASAAAAKSEAKARFTTGEHKMLGAKIIQQGF